MDDLFVMAYKDDIKHPKWQRMRLKIMDRDNFSCRHCGATEITLNVHHLYYLKGHKIWNYPMSALITLCEECHLKDHKYEHLAGLMYRYITDKEYRKRIDSMPYF